MDTIGIKMLKSIDILFELLPISINKLVFVKESFKKSDLLTAISDQKKCPVVQTIDLSLKRRIDIQESLHIMVATGANKRTGVIQCKNSYHNEGEFI